MSNTDKIKELREKTGMPLIACKHALSASGDDIEEATRILISKGADVNRRRSGKDAAEGAIGVYVHADKKKAAFVELRCETDFVGRSHDFTWLADELAKQVVAMQPRHVSRERLSLKPYYDGFRDEAISEGKPENIADKIAEGRVNKMCSQECLLEQPWIRDDKKVVQDLVNEVAAKVKEKIVVHRISYHEIA